MQRKRKLKEFLLLFHKFLMLRLNYLNHVYNIIVPWQSYKTGCMTFIIADNFYDTIIIFLLLVFNILYHFSSTSIKMVYQE